MKNKSLIIAQSYGDAFLEFLISAKVDLNHYWLHCLAFQDFFAHDLNLVHLQKTNIVEQKKFFLVFCKRPFQIWRSFFYVLIDDQNIFYIPKILDYLQIKLEKKLVIQRGEVNSVIPLTNSQINKLNLIMSKLLKKKVLLRNKLDVHLIGGIKLQIQDMVWNNSISFQLKKLYQKLLK